MSKQNKPVQPKPKTWQLIVLVILIMVLAINLLGYIPQPQDSGIPSIQSNALAATKTAIAIAGIAAIILVLFKSRKR